MTASVTKAARSGREEQPEYRLAREPDGRSWTVRENLANILERELLGPANGPDELLNGTPDLAYLVGRIAPVRLTAGRDDPTGDDPTGDDPTGDDTADDDTPATDVGDAVDADEGRGVPVTAVDESSAAADEDSVEDAPQQRGLMIPASMGMRFQIPADLDTFTVVASWGTYRPVKDERPDAPRSCRYQRTPVEVTTTVTVADLVAGVTKPYPLHDKVVLRVDRCAGCNCSTATGWSSRSGAPAQSTGTPHPPRGRPPRCGPPGCRPARPRRPPPRRSRLRCWTWRNSPRPTAKLLMPV
jgi:hypothetical protein